MIGASNPYRPGSPADPAAFVGRTRVTSDFSAQLRVAMGQNVSGRLLLHGDRGAGKTSTLRKLKQLHESWTSEGVFLELPARAFSVEEGGLLAAISAELQAELDLTQSRSTALRNALSEITSLSVGPFGVGRTERARPYTPLSAWRRLISALRGTSSLVLSVDDAQLLPSRELGTLKTIAEATTSTPVILVVAGTPELGRSLLRGEGSAVGRVFSGHRYDLDAFTEGETQEALLAPLQNAGDRQRWTPEGVASVFDLTGGNPFLVQCTGAAVFERIAGPISAGSVATALPRVLEIGAAWLEDGCAGATSRDIEAFKRIATTTRRRLSAADLASLRINGYRLRRLLKLGILSKVAKGQYRLSRAPAVAFYHSSQGTRD